MNRACYRISAVNRTILERKNTALIISAVLFLWLSNIYAYFDEQEPALAPLTLWTSDVLREGEVFFCPWGWTAAGISDRVTLEWDWKLALVLCPAGYIKMNCLRNKNFGLSIDILDYYIRPHHLSIRLRTYSQGMIMLVTRFPGIWDGCTRPRPGTLLQNSGFTRPQGCHITIIINCGEKIPCPGSKWSAPTLSVLTCGSDWITSIIGCSDSSA